MQRLLIAGLVAGVACASQAQVNKSRTSESGTESTQAQSREKQSKQTSSTTIKVSANAALLRAWVELFEINSPDLSSLDPTTAGQLQECLKAVKIVSQPTTGFPSWCVGSFQQGSFQRERVCTFTEAKQQFSGTALTRSPSYDWSTQKPLLLACYVLLPAIADNVLAAAGDILKKQPRITNINTAATTAVKSVMASDALVDAYNNAMAMLRVSHCVTPLNRVNLSGAAAEPFTWDCGNVFVNAGERTYRINGRPALSEEFIGGKNIEVTLADEASESDTKTNSRSKFKKDTSGTTKTYQKVQ